MPVTDYGQALKTIREFIPVQSMTGVLPSTTAGSSSTTTSGIDYGASLTVTSGSMTVVSGISYTTTSGYVTSITEHFTTINYVSSVTLNTATFSGVIDVTASVESVGLASLGAGEPVISEHSVTASEILSMKIGAAGDEVYHAWLIPQNFNEHFPFRWRPIFSTASTDTDAPVWKLFYMFRGEGEAVADITTHETLSLTHTVSATANAIEIPDFDESASQDYITQATDYAILFRLECDSLGSASANEIELLGLEIEYTAANMASDERYRTTLGDSVTGARTASKKYVEK